MTRQHRSCARARSCVCVRVKKRRDLSFHHNIPGRIPLLRQPPGSSSVRKNSEVVEVSGTLIGWDDSARSGLRILLVAVVLLDDGSLGV